MPELTGFSARRSGSSRYASGSSRAGSASTTTLFPRFVWLLAWAVSLPAVPGMAEDPTFGGDVLPILTKRCASCHQGPNAQNGLRVVTVADLLRGGRAGPAIVPGNPDSSLLLSKAAGEAPVMPPVGDPLTPSEIAVLRSWISTGASGALEGSLPAPESVWWSLRPLSGPDEPKPYGIWEQSKIDGFLLAAMQGKGLTPSDQASRRTLFRRLSFDLTGLPPDADAVEAFVNDSDPAAYERLVDRLLASPAYGERWGRHWLDVARFGESNGYEQNHLRENAWPYRDWVIRSFNEDKPFNRMIVEQLAGDQLAPDDPDVNAATGFLVAGPHDTVGIRNPEGEAQKRANHLDDIIMGTASAFLGLTVHCARCHDHKFDPIQTNDYYRIQAAFAGVWHGQRTWDDPDRIRDYETASNPLSETIRESSEGLAALRVSAEERIEANRAQILARYRPSVDPAGTEEIFDPVEARFVRMTIFESTRGGSQVDLDEFAIWTSGAESRNIALDGNATARSTRVDSASPDTYSPMNLVDGKFDQRWISSGGLPSWIQVELPRITRIERVEWSSDRIGGFRGRFGRPQPEEYMIEVSTDGEAWETVATSDGRLPFSQAAQQLLLLFAVFTPDERESWEDLEERKSAAEKRFNRLQRPRTAFLGKFVQPKEPSFVMIRGNPMNRGAQVAPGSLSTLENLLSPYELEPDAPESERRLALARWIASDDNALTARVIVNRVWMYHFGRPLVRNPSDFGINGGEPTHPELLDWLAERLVQVHRWRLKPLHKDIVLSAAYRQSGQFREAASRIDRDGAYLWRFPPRRLGAEELRDSILSTSGNLDRRMGGRGFRLYRYTVDNVATYYPLDRFTAQTYRRSVYHQHARSVKPELLGEFDCPDTSLPSPKRISTTSPLQALSLMNNRFILDQAASLARLVEAGSDDSDRSRVERAWRLAFGRAPTDEETAAASSFVAEEGLESLGRALLNSNEFLYVF